MNSNTFHNAPAESNKDEKINKWFSDFIDDIKVDHFLLTTQTASVAKQRLYDAIISGDEESVARSVRETSSKYMVKKLVYDYLQELRNYNKIPLKLAFGLSDSKILVWSEINDDDELAEDALLLAEAKINGKYHSCGFYINSTIIEKSDRLPVPPHYHQTILDNNLSN